jgi:hypothetical protein
VVASFLPEIMSLNSWIVEERPMSEKLPESFIFMKVGNHAGESFDAILTRKNREREQAGCIFWGYGGTVCHPLMQVQPFARLYTKKQGCIYLFMEPMESKANPDIEPAREYSEDGARWHSLPEGISVIGSKYALVLDEINPINFEIDLEKYSVGIGYSRGKNAAEYIQGRVDKGCLTLASAPHSSTVQRLRKSIKFSAQLF